MRILLELLLGKRIKLLLHDQGHVKHQLSKHEENYEVDGVMSLDEVGGDRELE